ncbi:hypothetical protein BJ138DRAFT_992229, partial [Hygrophoropsis aurantiaca]
LPSTRIVAHAPGWTVFDNLYVLNGTVFVVTDKPGLIPDRALMTSTAVKIGNGKEMVEARIPGDAEMRIVSTAQAKALFGRSVELLDGVSVRPLFVVIFITHYYHWSAELFFGFWRTYSSLASLQSSPSTQTQTPFSALPSLRRIIFAHADADHWRDYALMNQYVLRAVFPSLTAEYSADWADRAALARPVLLDRVVFSDRAAAMNGQNFLRTGRSASEAFALGGAGGGGGEWWAPVRDNVVRFAGLDTRSWLPFGADVRDKSLLDAPQKPVITYISRQDWGRRMLIPEDHEGLVRALRALEERYGWEVHVVSMDKLSRVEQIRLAARTTVMLGVHGNGLTSLVWMQPSPRATVIEFFFPGGFAHDYEYTARALGMVHVGFWGNESFTAPNTPPAAYPEGFQGNSIPLDGEAVARVVVERVMLAD